MSQSIAEIGLKYQKNKKYVLPTSAGLFLEQNRSLFFFINNHKNFIYQLGTIQENSGTFSQECEN